MRDVAQWQRTGMVNQRVGLDSRQLHLSFHVVYIYVVACHGYSLVRRDTHLLVMITLIEVLMA